MPLKHRHHRCPEVKEIDIPASKITGWTILAAVWWKATNNVLDLLLEAVLLGLKLLGVEKP